MAQDRNSRNLILHAEVEANIATGLTGQTDGEDLTPPYPVRVHKIILTEDSLRADDTVAASQNNLGLISTRWWGSTGKRKVPRWRPIPAVYAPSGFSFGPLTMAANGDYVMGSLLLPSPILVPRGHGMAVDWENPAVDAVAGLAGATFNLAACGKGVESGADIVLSRAIAFTASAGSGAAGPTGVVGVNDDSRNDYGEDVLIDRFNGWVERSGWYPGGTDPFRPFSHVRINPAFGPGPQYMSPQGRGIAPLVVYAADVNPIPSWAASVRPSDDVVRLAPDVGAVFEFQNNTAFTIRPGVTLICVRED